MARKKTQKITKAPGGKSFMYEPRDEAGPTKCPDCGKGDVILTRGGFPTCTDGSHFVCSKKCGWKSASGNFKHTPTKPTKHYVETRVVKKHKSKKDSSALRKRIAEEFLRRRKLCIAERKKFPPSLVKKGKRWVSNPKFTPAMREHMSKFQFSPEAIRDEILKEANNA
jgi:hypothetical protein